MIRKIVTFRDFKCRDKNLKQKGSRLISHKTTPFYIEFNDKD